MSQAGILDVASSNPQIATQFDTDSGSAIPVLNILEILGTTALAGTTPLSTSGSGNTVTVIAQISQALAAADATKIGLANFDSSHFAVDADGFVTLSGGGLAIDSIAVDAGTSPIVPTAAGLITVNGTLVTAGTTPIQTNGTDANTYAVEVQISQANAGSDVTRVGLCHFDSDEFAVDPNGYVTLLGQQTGSGQTIGAVTDDVITIDLGSRPGTYTISASVSGFESGTPAGAGYRLTAMVRTTGAAGALIGAVTQVIQEEAALAAGTATIVVAANTAIIRCTGVAALTIEWGATSDHVFAS